jgi:large subunit ribosomal protein L25
MNNTGVLNVETRTNTSTPANNRLRSAGYMPGNIYGKDMDSIAVSIRKDELRKNIAKHGRSAVFQLMLDGTEKYNVMIKDIQFTHVSQELIHVDFHSISLSEETKANVPVRAIGDELYESKRLLLQIHRDIIPIKGLPQDIPNFIEIDVEDMEPGDNIFISDISFPDGITPELEDAQLVLSVSEAKIHQEETEEETEDVEVEEPEQEE